MSAPVTTRAWCRGFLADLGMKPTLLNSNKTYHRVTALLAWKRAENGERPCDGTPNTGGPRFNAFATTHDAPGATNYNSVGVKNYVSASQGQQATADTLHTTSAVQYGYDKIIAALKKGDEVAVCQAIANSSWGTGDGALKALPYVKLHRNEEAKRLIG